MEIRPYTSELRDGLIDLALRAWDPVFDALRPAVPNYVYKSFWPNGWKVRQSTDIDGMLLRADVEVITAMEDETLLGFVGLRRHPEDNMGEIYIIAVDPMHQRKGVAAALMDHALARFREEGLRMVMVETGDDPGHAPSRAAYEAAGFDRWPVARYFRKL